MGPTDVSGEAVPRYFRHLRTFTALTRLSGSRGAEPPAMSNSPNIKIALRTVARLSDFMRLRPNMAYARSPGLPTGRVPNTAAVMLIATSTVATMTSMSLDLRPLGP